MSLTVYRRRVVGRQLAASLVVWTASDFDGVHWPSSWLSSVPMLWVVAVVFGMSPCALVWLLGKVGVFPMSLQATAAQLLAKQLGLVVANSAA